MVGDDEETMTDRDDGALLPPAGRQPAELARPIGVLALAGGPGGFPQRRPEPGAPLAGAGGQAGEAQPNSAALAIARAHARPCRRVPMRREAAHVRAEFR